MHPVDNTPGTQGYDNMVAAIQNDPTGAAPWWSPPGNATGAYDAWSGMERMVLINWNGGDVTTATSPNDYDQLVPEVGTVFRIVTSKPNGLDDVFDFTAPEATFSLAKVETDVDEINVFPNPYYCVNSEELNKYQRFVTISHLPQKATIRIFNLAGQSVRVIDKDDASQYLRWDLSNEDGFPVGSGLYIIYIDMPDIQKQKIIKAAIIQEEQILDRF
jgi:hypothetical protein